MELNREQFRALIYYDFKSNLTQQQCLERLHTAFGECAPSRTTIFHWYAEFKRGRGSLEDDPRPGRPLESVTVENVSRVRELVKQNRNISCRQLQQTLGIGSAAINLILHERLGLRKIASRWIPHLLTDGQMAQRVDFCRFMLEKFDGGSSKSISEIVTGDETWIYQYDPETKQQSTVWVFEDEDPPTKVVRSRSVGKQMLAVFFRRSGPVAVIPLLEQRTVTAQWYCEVALPSVFQKLEDSRPGTGLRGILWHHDNASSHTAARTIGFLSSSGVQLLPHPPYSPDLSPCDYFLFPKLKSKLKGIRFESPESAVHAFESLILSVPQSEWHNCYTDWFRRMQLCISSNGKYFEKM
jgi:histone-lysine N-methyltransferase SETMAR